MTDVQEGAAFPTSKVIISGFVAGAIAFVISLIAFVALTDRGMAAATGVALAIGGVTTMVTIIVQVGIHMSRRSD